SLAMSGFEGGVDVEGGVGADDLQEALDGVGVVGEFEFALIVRGEDQAQELRVGDLDAARVEYRRAVPGERGVGLSLKRGQHVDVDVSARGQYWHALVSSWVSWFVV
ncbi:hypothetical protein, partial [Streptomyces sp. col6]|uniref:hypothetical protein n=1 Tax=Streptomyces sp. col6 TaxID=2478958 RepID=UPI001CD184C7